MIATTAYDWLKFGHVASAVIWVGSGVLLALLALRAQRSGDPARLAATARDAAWAGQFVFGPASLAALLFGIGAVLQGDLDWGDGWLSAGIALYVVSSAIGGGYLSRQSKLVREELDANGDASPEAARRIRRLIVAARLDVGVQLAAVAVMTLKP